MLPLIKPDIKMSKMPSFLIILLTSNFSILFLIPKLINVISQVPPFLKTPDSEYVSSTFLQLPSSSASYPFLHLQPPFPFNSVFSPAHSVHPSISHVLHSFGQIV